MSRTTVVEVTFFTLLLFFTMQDQTAGGGLLLEITHNAVLNFYTYILDIVKLDYAILSVAFLLLLRHKVNILDMNLSVIQALEVHLSRLFHQVKYGKTVLITFNYFITPVLFKGETNNWGGGGEYLYLLVLPDECFLKSVVLGFDFNVYAHPS